MGKPGQYISAPNRRGQYDVGVLGFDLILTAFRAGMASGAKFLPQAMKWLKGLKLDAKNIIGGLLNEADSKINKVKGLATKIYKCKILGKGCFVAGTPVLMASNTIGQSGKIYAVAAMMPFAMVPVDDTPLLSYALANKSVNSNYTMTASNNDDVSMALMNAGTEHSRSGDPYTSAEQKQRDLYKINVTDWYSVSFEGVYSSSVCHLAMHNDWIQSRGYVVDGMVNMNLPEQGISGPFKITSIKHITPQKKPIDEDPNDDYEYRPVTGLFVHNSNDVWKITFDNGETLGVTNNHPIFSVSKGDWQHAGHL